MVSEFTVKLEKEEKSVKINKITGEACKKLRPLWEEVFYEDSKQFTDYYFEHKAEKNIGYVIGAFPHDAMMFRTPYELKIGEMQREISYIVGVATRKECRHRGYMRELLLHSFQEMYREKNPFTFLMPANPAIYEPFDFKYIYERDVWELKNAEETIPWLESLTNGSDGIKADIKETKEDGELRAAEYTEAEKILSYSSLSNLDGLCSVRSLYKQREFSIFELLAEFANRYLREHYDIYVHRDASYYEMQLKESEAQNGDIYVLFEKGSIKAFFLYAKEENEIFLQEVMEDCEGVLGFLQKTEKKKPMIMARIIHLEEMMKLVCSKENRTMVMEIEDELIPENAGTYIWEMTASGSQVTKIRSQANKQSEDKSIKSEQMALKSDRKEKGETIENPDKIPKVSMHIREFAPWVLTGAFINEIV